MGPVCVDANGVALGGYDAVSYFKGDGTPVKGTADLSAEHEGAKYHFASDEHRAAFVQDPGKYLPQYGGYCAAGMAGGYKAPTDPLAATIIDGKLYLNYSAKVVDMWKPNAKSNIAKADENWRKIK